MKYKLLAFVATFFVITLVFSQVPKWVSSVGAKTFPNSTKIFYANDYGAINDTFTINTKSIQAAIDACAKNGGGIVAFKSGTYVSGSIFIKSNVHLRIDKGVLILGSQNFTDYPEIQTRIAGIETTWPAALINFLGVKNSAITGNGIINARGKFCWDLYWNMRKDYDKKGLRWIVDYDAKRVRTLLVQNSENISIKQLTFKNAGFWTVQLLYSTKLTVDGITIKNNEDGSGPSTDGIDVDSSTWTLIENCDIDCNDDNFCLKAGRDWDGLRVNKPTEYVVIRKCKARRGAGLVTLGSETSGSIRHIYCSDLVAKHTDNGLRIKSATTRGGIVEDVYFVNSILDSIRTAFQFNLNWYPAYSYSELPKGYVYDSVPQHWKAMLQKVTPTEKGIPHTKDFFIQNVKITNAQKAFEVNGLLQSQIENFNFSNSLVTANLLGEMVYAKSWKYSNFEITITQKPEERKKISAPAEEERLK